MSNLDSDFTIEAHLGANSQDFIENSLWVRGQSWPPGQTCHYLSTILLGTIYWPFFSQNPNIFIGIGIGCISYFWVVYFGIVLLLVVFKTINIVLYLIDIWYLFGIFIKKYFINCFKNSFIFNINVAYFMKMLHI